MLAKNYPPSLALAPYIRSYYSFSAELPEDFQIVDRLVSEFAFVRILLRGDWHAEAGFVPRPGDSPVLLFGPNARPHLVSVKGPFTVIGFSIRPSGWRSLFSSPADRFTDLMVPLQPNGQKLPSSFGKA